MDFQDKNVVYVGGFGGIGFATCKILLEKNLSNLVILDVQENTAHLEVLRTVNPSTKVTYMRLDLCDREQIVQVVKDVIAEIKYIDVLINGSGIINEASPELAIGVNLIGLIHTTLNVIPHMDKSNGGHGGLIANISSIAGLDPSPMFAVYCASKHGVMGFSRSISDEYLYDRTGIAIITICPGITNTGILKDTRQTFPDCGLMAQRFRGAKSQSAEECAISFVKAMETGKNGSIWMLDVGTMTEVRPPRYWNLTF